MSVSSGNKVLRKPLIGEKVASYYPISKEKIRQTLDENERWGSNICSFGLSIMMHCNVDRYGSYCKDGLAWV